MNIKTEEEEKSYLFALHTVIKVFTPIAPHLCSELMEMFSIREQTWPTYDEKLTIDNTVVVALSVNGKLRATMEIDKDLDKITTENLARQNESIKKYIDNAEVKKVIVVPNKMVNFVI